MPLSREGSGLLTRTIGVYVGFQHILENVVFFVTRSSIMDVKPQASGKSNNGP